MRPSTISRARAPGSALVVAVALASVMTLGGCAFDGDIGFIVGEPMGVSYKWEHGDRDFVVGAGFTLDEDGRGPHGHVDWILREGPVGMTEWEYYVGVGFVISQASLGPRAPLGLLYELIDLNGELFAEVAPVWDWDGGELDLNAALGVRFHLQ